MALSPSSRAFVVLGAVLLGCSSIGPRSVARDRFDYATAVGESWKQQTLLNVVKLRYLDVPVFLDVGQIVSGYTLETGVSLSGQVAPVDRGDTFGALGGGRILTERPTITYTPKTGDQFLRSLMSPLPVSSILYTLQAGYAADFILSWTVESLSGLHNRSTVAGPPRQADPAFVRALALMHDVQAAGGVSVGVEPDASEGGPTLAVFRAADLPTATLEQGAELRRLLGLPVDQHRFRVVAAPHRGGAGELTLQPRSLLQIMHAVSSFIEVPPEHLARRWALPAAEMTPEEHRGFGVRIRSAPRKPDDAYVAVQHQGHWFWVDQGDWRTKRTMMLLVLLFTLTDASEVGHLPVLTIPTS